MPKILEDIQERILDAVRERIAGEGWNAVNIRTLAKRCGIASGTIYNYYPSREAILAAVISRDWEKAEESILAFFSGSTADPEADAVDKLRFLHGVLSAFMGVYRMVWAESPGHLSGRAWERGGKEKEGFRLRMEEFVRLVLSGIQAAEGIDGDFLVSFIARSVIDWSGEDDFDFSRMEPVITALLA